MTKLPQMDVPEPPAPLAPPPPVKQPGKVRGYIGIAVLIAIIGAILFIVRNNQDAGNLAVGTCFDVPTASDFSTVEKHPCTEAHDGEVVLVSKLTGDSYPITLTLNNFINDNCVPAVETYTGRKAEDIEDLELGYFSPTRDAWNDGERTITCYLYDVNEAKLSKSVKAGAS